MTESLNFTKLVRGDYEVTFLQETGKQCYAATSARSSVIEQENLLRRPFVDQKHLRSCPVKPTWPKGAPFAVCLTHDVDEVSSSNSQMCLRKAAEYVRGAVLDLDGKALRGLPGAVRVLCRSIPLQSHSDPIEKYEEWLEIEAEIGARSTFLFLPGSYSTHHRSNAGYRYYDKVRFDGQIISVAEMMREIHERGWEIGLHASWHTYNSCDLMRREKDQIEAAIDAEIHSIRQHNLHFDIRCTPRIQQEAGLLVDSSLGFNDNIGFRNGTSYPWYLHDFEHGKETAVLELPLIVQDKALMDHVSSGSEDEAISWVDRLACEVEAAGGVLTLLWHPNYLDRPTWISVYRRTLALLKRRGAWFGTMAEIAQWWQSSMIRKRAGQAENNRHESA